MLLDKRLSGIALTLALVASLVSGQRAAAASVTIVVNGSTVTFDQPPIERAGRVFVPLRGVFERLGASVVYANGVINAQGNGRSVSLHIGSTQATVNGQPSYLDQAPFLVGARTLVPLRFVAQALGAQVNYDNGAQTVYINNGAGSSSSGQANASFNLQDKRPAVNANTVRPAVHATFSESVNRDSLHVGIDGRDVTSQVYANANGFNVTPDFDLNPGSHRVTVTGTTQTGASFNTGWSFATQNGASANYVRGISPNRGTKVGNNFTVSGRTLPNSNVHIVASGSTSVGGVLQVGTGTFQVDTKADANGNFSQPISVNAVPGGSVKVLLQSTSPAGASAEQTVVYGS
ncbi:MAG: copper amine oxidase N-terminal domain-containing protein [Vulcanimicrobiaceae bacterium]